MFRAPELGIWGLAENREVLEEAARLAGFINPTSNLSESANALFWMRLGGKKGGYLTSPEVVLTCARGAAVQIARRVEYERTGLVGAGPGPAALAMRAENRRKSYEGRAEVIEVGEDEGHRKKRSRSTGTGLGDPASSVRKGGEEGGLVTDRSTHRYDQTRIETTPVGFEFRGKYTKKVDLNEMPEETEVDFSNAEVIQQQLQRWEELKRELREKKDGREGGAGPGWIEPKEGEVESDRGEVWVKGEEKYRRTEWVVARLDVDDNAGCVGKKSAKEPCKVDCFASAASRGSEGALVFIK